MKIIKPSVEILTFLDGEAILKKIEQCGRVAYKSEDKITEDSAKKFVANLIKRGHESVLEHYSFTLKFVCDRGVSHELCRHRIASFTQESTRYCAYNKDRFGNQITVIEPCYLNKYGENNLSYQIWENACKNAENRYFELLELGCSPQEARAVLPNSLKTEVIMTANLREWRHFFKLRCDKAAHPQMREISIMALKLIKSKIPIVLDDIQIDN